jgi:hypothetical protein
MTRSLYAVCAALVLMAATPAGADPLTATYGLYTGGVRMIDVDATLDLGSEYHLRTDARTIGIFEKILPWSGVFKTSGAGDFKPVRHDYAVKWRGDTERSTFLYDPPGVFTSMTQTKDGETTENPIDLDIARDTRDLLSTLALMLDQYERTGSCASDVLTFDNARSFIVRFADAGDGVMDNPNLSTYTGPARACTVEIIPQKGKWPKKPRGWLRIQEQAKKDGRLPALWLAKPAEGKPVIPVRVDIHTKYGDVIAHLTGLK